MTSFVVPVGAIVVAARLIAMQKLSNWLAPVRRRLPPSSAEVEFREQSAWATGYKPLGDDTVYATIAKYAETQYANLVNHFDTSDKKADDLLRFMTTAIGAVIALIASKVAVIQNPYLLVGGAFGVLIALLSAMIAKIPRSTVTPITPRDLLAVADHSSKPTSHGIESAIAVSYHVAITAMKREVKQKSQLIQVTTYMFYAAFLLVLWALVPA